MTYRDLQARANRLAHYLKERGVGPGGLVGVCLERSIEAFVSLLGILKAGAAYVPLDPAYPPSRLAFMLADSGAPVLVTTRRTSGTGSPPGPPRSSTSRRTERRSAGSRTRRPTSGAGPQDLAYVIYTSGSTGKPKGVLAVHEASVNRFAWMWRRWPFTPHDVCCQKTSLSFVDSVWEIFGPLLQGVPSVIVPDDVGRRSGPPDRPAGDASGDPHRAGALGAPAAARHGSRPRAPCARSARSGSPAARPSRRTWPGASRSSCRRRRW